MNTISTLGSIAMLALTLAPSLAQATLNTCPGEFDDEEIDCYAGGAAPVCFTAGGNVTCNLNAEVGGGTPLDSSVWAVSDDAVEFVAYGTEATNTPFCCIFHSDNGLSAGWTAEINGTDAIDVIRLGNGSFNLKASTATVNGYGGDDILFGANNTSCHDVLNGDGDDDTLWGYAGDDTLNGGTGNDTAHGGDGDDTINGHAGDDTLDGGDGDDTVDGGDDDDVITGWDGEDTLYGGNGFNKIQGGLDDDWIEGGDDVDWLCGGLGDDELTGHGDADLMWGGVNTATDTIHSEIGANGDDCETAAVYSPDCQYHTLTACPW